MVWGMGIEAAHPPSSLRHHERGYARLLSPSTRPACLWSAPWCSGSIDANGLGFFVGKRNVFQVLALPYVLLPAPVEYPYRAQRVLDVLDLQCGAIYACLLPHQRYDALALFFLPQIGHARLPLVSYQTPYATTDAAVHLPP